MSLIFITIILFHRGRGRGKGNYVRGSSKKRVVDVAGRRSVISKTATNLGLEHESVKTGKIMPERKVMYCNIIVILFVIFIQST